MINRDYKIILGSQSARRYELLKGLDIDFEVRTIEGLSETYPDDLAVDKVAQYLAEQKADSLKSSASGSAVVITADTVVICDGVIYGKPNDRQQAYNMLRSLSGKRHTVITGVCILSAKEKEAFSSTTSVWFTNLTDEDIEYYIERYAPYDKAGSYGIQEWLGFVGVEKIEGSYYNVMGLPIQQIYKRLKAITG